MSEKKRIKFLVSYDGTDFCGWQKQAEHKHGPDKPSVQETLEKALAKLFNEKISLSGSGRTDAGVHALAQVGHFDTSRKMPKDFCWAIRSFLPPTIVVKDAWIAPEDFHATLSATRKTYRYWVWNSERPTAVLSRFTDWIRTPLDLDYLNEQAAHLVAEQDFKSFQSVGTPVHHTVREIYKAEWNNK